MKKSIIAIAFAAVFAACNSNPKTSVATANQAATDTTGLAQFQMFKQQQALREQLGLIEANGVNDRLISSNNFASDDVSETGNLGGEGIDRTTRPTVIYRDKPVYRNTPASTRRSSRARSTGGSGTVRSNSGGSGTSSQPTVTARKKGWSKAAKGAVIGGGSGAVLGAIVSKNKVKGAIIGGVLGAGGGYAIGRGKDKKDGRYYLPMVN
jgi:hypothetical protein